jgi:hypothetical protein
MHLWLTKSSRVGFFSDGSSTYLILLNVLVERSGGFSVLPLFSVFSPSSWFHSLQAV